ncbi:MAG TPA: hypothetical protein VMU37_10545 [Caulobacteraceae bacterium]|nr:hypothetical protein [Caulobacteraceae bacterium]
MTRPEERRSPPIWATLAPLAFVVAGAALRLSFPLDIEYKSDERGFFESAHAIAAGGPWPWIGFPSSVGAPASPLPNWIFALMARLFGAPTPPDLARCVQALNVVALGVFAGGAMRMASPWRAAWLWAAALWAVNPVAVILERKIWNPSLLPLPVVLLIFAWLQRKRWWAAFGWGLLGSLIVQIHIAGVFLVASLAAWTWAREPRAFPWLGWVAGSLVGAASAVPWLEQLTHFHHFVGRKGLKPPYPGFYLRFFTQPFGFGSDYSLSRKTFMDFAAWPRIQGGATWLVGLAHVALAAIAATALIRGARAFWAGVGFSWRSLVLGRDEADTLICAVFWGYGGILTLITIGSAGSERHYLELVAPVMALWCARLVLSSGGAWARLLLPSLCALQLAVSASLLVYIDQRQLIPGDYGTIWRAQTASPAVGRNPSPG